jgi:hypothetical protein
VEREKSRGEGKRRALESLIGIQAASGEKPRVH